MNALKKYWYLILLLIITIGLGVIVFLTSQQLTSRQPVAPTVPQSTPQAAEPACTLPFTIAPPTITDLCLSAEVSRSTLAPGQIVTLSSTSKSRANNFTYALYNLDNLYGPGNAKPICVTTGGDFTAVTEGCPTGTHHLIFQDLDRTARTRGFREVPYEKIFVADQNNGGGVVSKVSITSYFSVTGGATSTPQGACIVSLSAGTVSVTNTPTETPTSTPTATETPTSTPTATATVTPTLPPDVTATPTQPPQVNASPTPTQSLAGPTATQAPLAQAPSLPDATPTQATPQVPVAGIGPSTLGVTIITIGTLLVLLGLAF